jgi:DNA invertase Pin-like site-specific DNA recombinase
MDTAIYARLSRYRSGGLSPNVRIQKLECREFATDQGWTILDEAFDDDDTSASRYTKKPRPGYGALLAAIEANLVEVVLVTEMERLYRRPAELDTLFALAERTRLRKIETTNGMGYDLSTPEGIHNARNAVANAEYESNKISVRSKRKKRALARDGQYSGGRRPFGYDYLPAKRNLQGEVLEPGRLVPNRREVAAIRWCAIRLLHGDSLRYCAARLNGWELPTTLGKRWRPSNLKRVLTAKYLLGIRVHRQWDHAGKITSQAEYPATWPPVMQRTTWDKLHLLLNDEARFVGAARKGGRSYLLTGIARCGYPTCGQPLVGGGALNHKGTSQRAYQCRKHDDTGRKVGCGSLRRLADPVEEYVRQSILATIDRDKLAEILAAQQQDDAARQLLAAYQQEKDALKRAARAHTRGVFDEPTYLEEKAEIEDRLERIERKLDRFQSLRTLTSLRPDETLAQAWDAGDLDWRRNLVTAVIRQVRILPGKPGRSLWATDRGAWYFDTSKVKIDWRV